MMSVLMPGTYYLEGQPGLRERVGPFFDVVLWAGVLDTHFAAR